MINNKLFEHRPIDQLVSIVKNDFKKMDEMGLIDEGTLIKTVMYCNDKLGLPIREIRQIAVPVNEYVAQLPADFEKLFYICALQSSNSMTAQLVNPFDNNFDQDIIYEANLDRESLGGVQNYQVSIKRQTNTVVYHKDNWVELAVDNSSLNFCHSDCPNLKKKGTYSVSIREGEINVPFRQGMLYIMYVGLMKDEDGNITFPFHPMITPYYEWSLKEKILSNAIFNSDLPNLGELYKLAQQERLKAWVEAQAIVTEKGYVEYKEYIRKKELKWYNQYFKYLQ